ncbi:MAG: hypothetical protein EOP48_10960 [Sphingobacteriales bacterium]|nr:MAG: hypothetical protein EOP48_10960 [Sphingobacteriales bacterium]
MKSGADISFSLIPEPGLDTIILDYPQIFKRMPFTEFDCEKFLRAVPTDGSSISYADVICFLSSLLETFIPDNNEVPDFFVNDPFGVLGNFIIEEASSFCVSNGKISLEPNKEIHAGIDGQPEVRQKPKRSTQDSEEPMPYSLRATSALLGSPSKVYLENNTEFKILCVVSMYCSYRTAQSVHGTAVGIGFSVSQEYKVSIDTEPIEPNMRGQVKVPNGPFSIKVIKILPDSSGFVLVREKSFVKPVKTWKISSSKFCDLDRSTNAVDLYK